MTTTRARIPQPRAQRALAAVCGALLACGLLTLSAGNAIGALAAAGDQAPPAAQSTAR